MENQIKLPFRVGDLAEAKSFQSGFRGAWFRCKIKEISKRKGEIGHVLEYYDFPDEKLKWMKLYQVPPYYVGKSKDKHRELMLRPCYPPVDNENEMPDFSEISEVTVIVHNAWKVGDLVDWFTEGCYWSGRIIKLFGDDKAQIELKPKPFGEGGLYDGLLKDVRPSLDWTPEYGWTMPTQEGDSGPPSARLIKPLSQVIGRLPTTGTRNAGQETEAGQGTAGPSVRLSFSSPVPSNSVAGSDAMETSRETSRAETDRGHTSAEPVAEVAEVDLKNYKPREGTILNSTRSDTLEAAVLDLEEYLNKVKWLKQILQSGIPSSDAPGSKWEFVDTEATAK